MKSNWSVAVVYEDTIARGEAQAFCDRLMAALWKEHGLDVEWWSFDSLSDAANASTVAEKASKADVLILANRPHSPVPSVVRSWSEMWLQCRGTREGMLVGVSEPIADASAVSTANYAFLRELAHRAGMDYLNEVPQNLGWLTDSPEDYCQRAAEVTTTLDSILRKARSTG